MVSLHVAKHIVASGPSSPIWSGFSPRPRPVLIHFNPFKTNDLYDVVTVSLSTMSFGLRLGQGEVGGC